MNHQAHDEQASAPIRPLYIAYPREDGDGIDLIEMASTLWKEKWWVLLVTALFAAAGILYALLATPVYRAVVVLAPTHTEHGANLRARLGGLASLAGVALGAPAGDRTDAIASLRSRAFVEEFIQDNDLLPVLFADKWDAAAGRWVGSGSDEWPDIRDGVKYFVDSVRAIDEEAKTGLVTLTIEWHDPETATRWADGLVQRINARLRERDLAESERRLAYLSRQLESANLVELRQAISRLVEDEIQTIMLAQAETEYAFRVIDPARVPHEPAKPKKRLVIILAAFLGGVFGAALVLIRHAVASSRR